MTSIVANLGTAQLRQQQQQQQEQQMMLHSFSCLIFNILLR
jgi:hypothetical protein